MATIKKSQSAQEREWQVESAMSTILRYNDLMKDKALMKDVQKRAQDQLATVNTNLRSGGVVAKKASAPKKAMVKKAVIKAVSKKKK